MMILIVVVVVVIEVVVVVVAAVVVVVVVTIMIDIFFAYVNQENRCMLIKRLLVFIQDLRSLHYKMHINIKK